MVITVSNLRMERLLRRLSQEQLAGAARISQTKLSRIERGLRPASPAEIKAIAAALTAKTDPRSKSCAAN